MAWHTDGCDTDYLLAPEEYCMKLPDELNFMDAAIIGCAGGTTYAAVKKLDLSGRTSFVLFGAELQPDYGSHFGNRNRLGLLARYRELAEADGPEISVRQVGRAIRIRKWKYSVRAALAERLKKRMAGAGESIPVIEPS